MLQTHGKRRPLMQQPVKVSHYQAGMAMIGFASLIAEHIVGYACPHVRSRGRMLRGSHTNVHSLIDAIPRQPMVVPVPDC